MAYPPTFPAVPYGYGARQGTVLQSHCTLTESSWLVNPKDDLRRVNRVVSLQIFDTGLHRFLSEDGAKKIYVYTNRS